jgi:hypothetical protein
VVLKPVLASDTMSSLLTISRLWNVRLRFRKGFLMQSGDDALFIGTDEASPGPYHILLSKPDFNQLADWDVGSIVTSQRGYLGRGRLFINISAAVEYGTSAAFLDCAASAWAEKRLKDFLQEENPETGFGCRARMVCSEGGPIPFSPMAMVGARSRLDLLKWMIGRGTGLTPGGDDFIIGLLVVSPQCGELHEQVAALISRPGLTGLVSLAYHRAALARRFDHTLCLMTEAAVQRNENLFMKALTRILSHGHSSGADLLCGILFALSGRGKKRKVK